jgi:hypothetical protein
MPTIAPSVLNFLAGKRTLVFVMVLATIGVTVQNYFFERHYTASGAEETMFNNFRIYESSFHHLVDGKDLYPKYPEEYFDNYKYSPTFAFAMGAITWMPEFFGLLTWNALNVLIFCLAIFRIPVRDYRFTALVFLITLIELITSVQNSQSNPLMCGLIILAYDALERKRSGAAACYLTATVFIKLFGAVAFVIFLFYPRKMRFLIGSLLSGILFFALPLMIVPFDHLLFLYKSWFALLREDHGLSYGLSVMGIVQSWFGIESVKNSVVLAGLFLLLLPLIRVGNYRNEKFRLLYLCSILIWLVIFNHKAESPTFIIAMTGVAIWFVTEEKSVLNYVLLFLSMLLTVLSPTDIFPSIIRDNYIVPLCLKALPCLLVWMKITYDLMTVKYASITENHSP